MIYLIGGPPRCGKTTVARHLAQRTSASLIPIDYLDSVVYHYLSDAERARRFPLLQGSLDTIYATFSPAEIVAHYTTTARTLWPAIQVFIHFALAHQQDVILEGYHIEPALMQEFTFHESLVEAERHDLSLHMQEMLERGTGYALVHRGDANIKSAFLYRQDELGIADTLTVGADEHDWVRSESLMPETRQNIATMIGTYGCYIRDEAARYGLAAFSMDGNFLQRVDAVTKSLLK